MAVVKTLDLQTPFATRSPWTVSVSASTDDNAQCGEVPIQLCFSKGATQPSCKALSTPAPERYPLQSLSQLAIVPLTPTSRALVVSGISSGCGSGYTSLVALYSYDRNTDTFAPGYSFSSGSLGDWRFIADGPLAGDLVVVSALWAMEDGGHYEPHRYSVEVRRDLPGFGYTVILGYQTTVRYAEPDIALKAEIPLAQAQLGRTYPGRYAP